VECGGKRSATPLWIRLLQKSQEIQSAAVVGALQIRRLQMQQEFFSSLLVPGAAKVLCALRLEELLRRVPRNKNERLRRNFSLKNAAARFCCSVVIELLKRGTNK